MAYAADATKASLYDPKWSYAWPNKRGPAADAATPVIPNMPLIAPKCFVPLIYMTSLVLHQVTCQLPIWHTCHSSLNANEEYRPLSKSN